MNISLTIQEKKFFIQCFLKHYELKKCECTWILEYLLTDDTRLNNIHFVSQAEYCPRAIIMTATCSDEIPFRFHKKHVITIDVDKSFHDLRLYQHKPMYLQINFYNSYQNPFYMAVLEENPYVHEDIAMKKQDQIIDEQILEKVLIDQRQTELKKKIDQALMENNRTDFIKLVDELNKFNHNHDK